MTGILLSLLGGKVSVEPDPYFEYTTLLLPGNGTNGAQNNTFLDGSTNNFTITRNGNTTQGTFSPFSQTGWGYYVPEQVSNQVNFTTSAGTDFQFAGDFTIEGWLYAANNSGDGSFYVISDNVNYLAFNISISANVFNIYLNNSTPVAITSDIPLATWTHVAMVRSGSGSGNIKLYTNGVLKGSTTNTSTLGYANPVVSRIGGGVAGIDRYYSNLRICKSAVYTGAFTPSTIPLTTTSQSATNCVLLTANSNRFLNQAVGATATITGSPRVVAFSPFNPTASWSAATNGGSGYFDGSGDYLIVPSNSVMNFGTGDFTIEAWVYPTATPGDGAGPIAGATGDILFGYQLAGNSWGFGRNFVAWDYLFNQAPILNTWQHLAVSRSGTTLRLFFNGALVNTATNSTSYNLTNASNVGSNGSSGYLTGYITNIRAVKGTAVYTAAFTPPTAPLTAITNTSLLLNFTNAGIYDATSRNDLETVGNAQISTTQSKFGGSSMAFDGTGDYLLTNVASADLYTFGTGNFTIEMWVYVNSLPGTDMVIYDGRPSNGAYPCIILQGSTNKIIWYVNTNIQITATSVVPTSTWFHLAISRSGTSTKMFVDGTQSGSTYNDSTNYLGSANRPYIGANATTGTQSFNGYIQDLRVTKGYARYTANFTAPASPFPLL